MARESLVGATRGRPREFDLDEVVARAVDVFWAKGYQGTSLPDLQEATGLSRGSLYGAFGDKHGLFLLALDRYIEQSLERFDEELDPGAGAIEGLQASLNGYIHRSTGAAGKRGCLVVATAMELAGHDTEIAKRIRKFFKAVEGRFADALLRAEAEGSLRGDVDPAATARVLLSVVEGVRVVAKVGIDRDLWQASVDSVIHSLTR